MIYNSFHIISKKFQPILTKFNYTSQVVDLAGDRKGLELIFFRAATILKNTSDGRHCKILQLFCDANFHKLFGNVANFELEGCSDEIDRVNECKKVRQYREAHLIDMTKKLPFRSKVFHYVVCMYPLTRSYEKPMIDISELVRIIGDSGYILIGCNSNRWAYNQALEDLQQYTDTGVKLMTMQGAELLPEDYLSDENKEQASIPSEQEKYWLAVMRRGPRPS